MFYEKIMILAIERRKSLKSFVSNVRTCIREINNYKGRIKTIQNKVK